MMFVAHLFKYFDNLPVLLRVFSLNLVTFSIGTIFSWPSPCLPKLNGSVEPENNPLETPIGVQEESWLAAIALLAASFGSLLPTLMIRRIRKKPTLLILALPVVIGYIMFAFGSNIWVFFIGRVLCGITLGAAFQIVPRYVGEISETKNRGAMGCCFAIFMAIGHIFNLSTGPYTGFMLFNLLSAIFPIIFIILVMFYVEDSPYDVIDDLSKAESILRKLRCNSSEAELKAELEEIRTTVSSFQQQLKFSDFWKSKALRKSLSICVMLAVFQQLSGVNAIMSYMQKIFSTAGGDIPPEQSGIYVSLVQIVAACVAPQFVDRFGRKILLAVSEFGLFLSMFVMATYFYFQINNYDTSGFNWLPLLCVFVFIFCFNTGPGSVPYVLMGEVFPINAKNVSSTVTAFLLTLSGFAVIWMFPFLVDTIDIAYTFWIASGFSLLGFLLVMLIVPETKGKSFIEIQNLLAK